MPFGNERELIIPGPSFTAAARPDVIDSWDPTTSLTSLKYKEGQMDPRYVRPWIPRRRSINSNYRISRFAGCATCSTKSAPFHDSRVTRFHFPKPGWTIRGASYSSVKLRIHK